MAELIDKDELIQIIDTASDNLSERLKAVFIDIVAELPTTTEAEIRAMAIEEFIKRLYKIGEYREFDWEDIYKLADEMKAEQLKEV